MKKLAAILVIFSFLFIGCADDKVIDGVKYEAYGLLSMDKKSEEILYKPVWGNVVWTILLFETIIAPVYFLGWSLYEPIGVNDCKSYRKGCDDAS